MKTPILALVLVAAFTARSHAEAARKTYDIAAFVWPAYHDDPRARLFWPMGIGEWETVMTNEPKFPGHEQPRRPLWGYVNEADHHVMEMQIAAAADHGVNVFIYDWYWYDGLPFLEAALNEGYLKARNNDRVRFYLMWANHDATLGWDKRNADAAFARPRERQTPVWRGEVDRQEFEKIGRRWIERYFSHPSYYKIEGRPVLMIYDINELIAGLGGIDSTKDAIAWLREQTRKAGHPGLELQVSLRKDLVAALSVVAGDSVGTMREVVEQLGFDSITHYQICQMVDVNRDYNEAMKDVQAEWQAVANDYSARYDPHVSVGWDSSPRRARTAGGAIIRNNTPENFAKALAAAKDFVDARPGGPRLITINSWNEWTETSYLQPCDKHGYGYLEAVKRVFVDQAQ